MMSTPSFRAWAFMVEAAERSPRPGKREILRRSMPSEQYGAVLFSKSAATLPPVEESQMMPTSCPSSDCPRARSRTWRNKPPTGVLKTWRIFMAVQLRLEPALTHINDVTRIDLCGYRHAVRCSAGHVLAGNQHRSLIGPRAIASSDGDGVLYRNAVLVGEAAGGGDLTQNVEGAQCRCLNRDFG